MRTDELVSLIAVQQRRLISQRKLSRAISIPLNLTCFVIEAAKIQAD